MSGDTYGGVWRDAGTPQILDHYEGIKTLTGRLNQLAPDSAASRELGELFDILGEAIRRSERLEPVLRAVEFLDSYDLDEEGFREELADWERSVAG